MRFYNNLGLEQKIAAEAAKWPRHVFLNQTIAMLNFVPAVENIASIDVPALVLHGTDDVVTPLSLAQELTDALPNAELVMVEGANHFPQTEKPVVVNNIITRFAETLF